MYVIKTYTLYKTCVDRRKLVKYYVCIVLAYI